VKRTASTLLLALLCACGKGDALPDDLPGLKTVALQARDDAQSARAGRDPKKAKKAADLARRAQDRAAATLKEKADASPEDRALAADIQAAARDALRLSRLAAEEEVIRDRTTGLKASAYRTGRGAALSGTFHGLALAADQRSKGGALPKGIEESAVLGADLAERFLGRKKLPEGTPDWAGVASDLRSLAASPPPGMTTFFALALVLSRQDGLALVEIDSIDPITIKDPEQLACHLLLRGIILRLNGLPESGSDSISAAGASPGLQGFGPELQAGIHLFQAFSAIHQTDLQTADIEIVRAMKVWPNNPVAVYLTGERLGAMGEREAAAKSLEASAAGTDNEWLAKRFAARARELRDGQGPAEPLFLDSAVLRDVVLWHIWQAARTSAPAKRLQQTIDSARNFGARWTPGSGDAAGK
jgi:hypothetical protein